eukprot:TRINITY_DN33450_c0_g1_i1.p1 TRINITY_DN33450_c0_g1~~TRINITY_DN33450_c0_g1_i1.p1  ORF type:complete len:276 (+),score=43.92 TRINITY_DN33450_c0_g1_i1:71-898(+)
MAEASVTVRGLTGDVIAVVSPIPQTVSELKEAIREQASIEAFAQRLMKSDGTLLKTTDELPTESFDVMLATNSVSIDERFSIDASNPDELKAHYPYIVAEEPETITVKNGVLIKQGRAGGDQLYACEEGGMERIIYKISCTCDDARYNVGLGCYVGSGGDDKRSSETGNRFCFHPGMGGGQFRIEGPGGSFNRNIGFTPAIWEEKKGGTAFTIELNKSGNHQVTLTSPDGSLSHTATWSNPKLWVGEAPPAFGIYAGDIRSRGFVYYTNFAVQGE